MRVTVTRGPFFDNDKFREDNLSYTGSDDEEGRRRHRANDDSTISSL